MLHYHLRESTMDIVKEHDHPAKRSRKTFILLLLLLLQISRVLFDLHQAGIYYFLV